MRGFDLSDRRVQDGETRVFRRRCSGGAFAHILFVDMPEKISLSLSVTRENLVSAEERRRVQRIELIGESKNNQERERETTIYMLGYLLRPDF